MLSAKDVEIEQLKKQTERSDLMRSSPVLSDEHSEADFDLLPIQPTKSCAEGESLL